MASAGVHPRRRWLRPLLVAPALLAFAAPPPVRAAESPAAPLAIPAVPYVAQSEALCGGAALAMVLRYWGAVDVRAEDFAPALSPDRRGITTDALVSAAEARGVRAYALAPTPGEVTAHLSKGRPLIALISIGPGRHHYVVVLAWANGRVLFHDPAVAPFRVMPEAEWVRAWDAAARWTLLVLPAAEGGAPAATASPVPPPEAESDGCGGLVSPAVARARAGDVEAARVQLEAAAAWCPSSSAPLRELASLEFRRERWAAAQDLAQRAVGIDPSDAFAWRLLATSRFLDGRRETALQAWNRVGEPRLDLVTVDGLDRTPFRAVSDSVGVDAGDMLTPSLLRRAQRRVAALPALQASRVAYRPLPGGTARLEVGIVERPAWTSLRTLLLQSVAHAVSEHAAAAEGLAVARNGDTLRGVGFWHPKRLRGLVAASSPRALGLPGLVTAEILWDEQSYRFVTGDPLTRESRRRGALSVSDWWTADTKARVTVAADAWRDRGTYASLGLDLEQRLLGDHLALGGGAAGWWLGPNPFQATVLRAAARTSVAPDARLLRMTASYEHASAGAPLALWPGAGTGAGRAPLLRAHPLVDGGIVDGPAFGRTLLAATGQAEGPLTAMGPLRLRGAIFIDVAAVRAPSPRATFVDVGGGLRLRPPGAAWSFRLDLASPSGRWAPRVSGGWQADWPH